MESDQKMAAAVAAVMAYIKTEEEVVAMQMAANASAARTESAGPAPPVNLWGLNGRQTMMHLRNLMQMRSFHSARIR